MQTTYTTDNKSNYHKKVILFLRQECPLFKIAQEFSINIDNKTLFIDIVIQSPVKVAIEINPEHHYTFSSFFHKTYDRFLECQENDHLKQQWADANDYLYVILQASDFKKDELFKTKLREILK